MKTFIVISCVVALAYCAPTSRDKAVRKLPALRHEEIHDEYGQYAFRYITAENTIVSERGQLVPGVNGNYVLVVEGQYQFEGDDGQIYVTRYRGGPDGFHVDRQQLPLPAPSVPI